MNLVAWDEWEEQGSALEVGDGPEGVGEFDLTEWEELIPEEGGEEAELDPLSEALSSRRRGGGGFSSRSGSRSSGSSSSRSRSSSSSSSSASRSSSSSSSSPSRYSRPASPSAPARAPSTPHNTAPRNPSKASTYSSSGANRQYYSSSSFGGRTSTSGAGRWGRAAPAYYTPRYGAVGTYGFRYGPVYPGYVYPYGGFYGYGFGYYPGLYWGYPYYPYGYLWGPAVIYGCCGYTRRYSGCCHRGDCGCCSNSQQCSAESGPAVENVDFGTDMDRYELSGLPITAPKSADALPLEWMVSNAELWVDVTTASPPASPPPLYLTLYTDDEGDGGGDIGIPLLAVGYTLLGLTGLLLCATLACGRLCYEEGPKADGRAAQEMATAGYPAVSQGYPQAQAYQAQPYPQAQAYPSYPGYPQAQASQYATYEPRFRQAQNI